MLHFSSTMLSCCAEITVELMVILRVRRLVKLVNESCSVDVVMLKESGD